MLVSLLSCAAHGATPQPRASLCEPGPIGKFYSTTRLGVIDLFLLGARGGRVTYFECVGDRVISLGQRTAPPGDELTILRDATTWRCKRLVRRFAATATRPDGSIARGTHAIRTRSCAQRFDLDVPRELAPGARARIRIADRWRIGDVRTSLCIARPGRRAACRQVVFARGTRLALRSLRMPARGHWRVELRVAGTSTRATIAVGVRARVPKRAAPTLLATGDSTMDPLGSLLSDELGDEANVVSEPAAALSISRTDVLQRLAEHQVARLKPQTTVVSVGANEGWPMTGPDGVEHECCGEPWTAEYVRRLQRAMTTYGKRVFWLTVVAQRGPRRAPIVAAVNSAILRAAAALPEVHVIRMDRLFSPNGYRETIRYRGRDVRVREPDGVHLNIAGARIAAAAVAKVLRATPVAGSAAPAQRRLMRSQSR